MKNINFIIILVLFCSFYSCNKNDDETPKSSDNGYTFNSEFVPTNALILTAWSPEEAVFLLLDDNAVFNSTTGEFEGNSGQGVVIGIRIDESFTELIDLVGTYTEVIIDPNDYDNGEFAGGLFMNLGGLEESLNNNGTAVIADSGEVMVSYDSETEIFTLEYTLITDQGTITGFYEGVSQIYQVSDD